MCQIDDSYSLVQANSFLWRSPYIGLRFGLPSSIDRIRPIFNQIENPLTTLITYPMCFSKMENMYFLCSKLKVTPKIWCQAITATKSYVPTDQKKKKKHTEEHIQSVPSSPPHFSCLIQRYTLYLSGRAHFATTSTNHHIHTIPIFEESCKSVRSSSLVSLFHFLIKKHSKNDNTKK